MRVFAVAIWILCVLVIGGATGIATVPATASTHDAAMDGVHTIEIQLEDDGDAKFTVEKRLPVETEEDREAFERLAREFEGGDAREEFSVTVFERIAERASEGTGREMEIEAVAREARIGENAGRLILEFRWTNFADATDDRLEVGDAFALDGETGLSSLSEEQRLVIHAPEDYAIEDVEPDASIEPGTVAWEGPQKFDPGQPTVMLVPSGPISDDVSPLTIGLGIGLVAAIVALIYLLSRQRGIALPGRGTQERGRASLIASTREDGGERAPVAARDDEPEEPAEPEDDPFGGVDPELLSDEERVVRLLEAHGGRMKQANIVVETDWSNAKVSQLLSSMAEEGRIEKLRIGRENLITLVEDED